MKNRLQSELFLSDGAMGTQLMAAGVQGVLEKVVLDVPDLVTSIHKSYRDAGAQILLTQTFGAGPLRLQKEGLSHLFEELNTQAVSLARLAGGIVAGSVGPTQLSQDEIKALPAQDLQDHFREHARVLVAAGVDVLVLETFYNAKELSCALEATQDLEVPCVSSVTLTTEAKLFDGTSLDEVAALWDFFKPDLIGLNCSDVPELMQQAFARMLAKTSQRIWLKLNAGMPGARVSARDFAESCESFLTDRLAVIGACCGSEPSHIQALNDLLKKRVG